MSLSSAVQGFCGGRDREPRRVEVGAAAQRSKICVLRYIFVLLIYLHFVSNCRICHFRRTPFHVRAIANRLMLAIFFEISISILFVGSDSRIGSNFNFCL